MSNDTSNSSSHESSSLLTAPSIESALEIKHSITQQVEKKDLFVFLGKPSFRVLSDQELADIRHWLRNLDYNEELPNACRTYSRCLTANNYDYAVVYRVGENVIVADAKYPEQEWLATITHLLVYGPINEQHFFFFKGTFFSATTQGNHVLSDKNWTDQPFMVRRDYKRLCVYPLNLVERKVMLYPSEIRNSYLTVDADPIVGPDVSADSVHIPYYPNTNEVVKVDSTGQNFLQVASVSDGNVQGYPLKQLRGKDASGTSRWRANSALKMIHLTDVASEAIPHKLIAGVFFFNP